MKVKDAINDLKSGLLKPIYFLKGGDQFLQSFFIDKISRYFFNDQPENKYFLVELSKTENVVMDFTNSKIKERALSDLKNKEPDPSLFGYVIEEFLRQRNSESFKKDRNSTK